MGLRKCLLPKA